MKLKHLLLALTVPLVAFLGSCGGDSNDPKPTISLTAGANFVSGDISVMSDSMLSFSISATSGSGALSGISANYSVNGKPAVSIKDTAVNGNSVSFVIKNRLTASVDDIVTYTFTAKDANGQTASTSLKITVVPPTAPLIGFASQLVYNALNVGFENAYDLNKGVGLKTVDNATRKDLLDKTLTGAAQFSRIWGSDNNGKFVKVTANDYTNASTTTFLYNLWKANGANALPQTATLAVGDVYLVKTGQDLPFNLYILKVTKIQDLPAIGNHNDYVEFGYKKIDD